MKRKDYISWDEYFMGVSLLASKRSKDPNTQVGACIVDSNNIIISTGYNGFPYGCSDDSYPWVIYLYDKYADSLATMASKRMLESAGVKTTQLATAVDSIELSFNKQ